MAKHLPNTWSALPCTRTKHIQAKLFTSDTLSSLLHSSETKVTTVFIRPLFYGVNERLPILVEL